MQELIDKLKKVQNLSEIENIDSINPNTFLLAISKSGRYNLLENYNLRLDLNDLHTLEELVSYLLKDDEILYYLNYNGFFFTKEELGYIFNIISQKYPNKLSFFFEYFFANKEDADSFIGEREEYFNRYIDENGKDIDYILYDFDSFTKLLLQRDDVNLLQKGLESYSLSNLKLLVQFIKRGNKIPYYATHFEFAKHLFSLKDGLDSFEFCELLKLLVEKICYERKLRDSEETDFSLLVKDNIDYLIRVVSETKILPRCLVESSAFRDECIKRKRFDLAAQCVLPKDIINNAEVLEAYCKELNIDSKEFYERYKWILRYYKRNNNVFNTFLTPMLKKGFFKIKKEHFERFINDVEFQMSLTKLNDKELEVITKILDLYDYKDYDISLMVTSIVENIRTYQELINSLRIEDFKEDDLRKLVRVLEIPDNSFRINNFESLSQYDLIKRHSLENNFISNEVELNKDNVLKVIFNIGLKEAKYINDKYCYDGENRNILEDLKNSELPKNIYNYLVLINKIVECESKEKLIALYEEFKNIIIYDNEISLESFLRAQYTKLYSDSLYRIEEKTQVYGPKDNIFQEVDFKGKKIQVCIPRISFNMLIHCVGSCSLESDIIDNNFRIDWMDRPQLQDHFIACSYIDEKRIFSIRSLAQDKPIFGFDTLDGGSILAMGNSDIDSIGRYAKAYNGSREVQQGNGNRAKNFVPSGLFKATTHGYNEIVIERRNTDHSRSDELKRKPDYIIMMTDSLKEENFKYLDTLFQENLAFISLDDQEEIKKASSAKELQKVLVKYKEAISKIANSQNIHLSDLANYYVDLIMNAKYYEVCLKASGEFDIPLVILDKTYFFKKMLLDSSSYSEDEIDSIMEYYSKANNSLKERMYNSVAKGEDVLRIMNSKVSHDIVINC